VCLAYFVCILLNHLANSHAYELRSDAFTTVFGAGGEHGDIASHGSATVGFEFADDDAYEVVVLV